MARVGTSQDGTQEGIAAWKAARSSRPIRLGTASSRPISTTPRVEMILVFEKRSIASASF